MPQGFTSVPARDPNNPSDPDATIDALFPQALLDEYWKTKPVRVYNLRPAVEVLEAPERIYYGVRKYNEGGWCYVGRPKQFAKKPAVWVPLPQHLLFAVYMNPMYHVYLWRLEKTSTEDPWAPVDSETRYGGVSWQRNS